MSDGFDPLALRRAFGSFVTGVTVVTTLGPQGEPRGFTANSFTSVSLEPPLLLVCIARSASGYPVFTGADGFAVNILAEDQRVLSRGFAAKVPDRFAGVAWRPGPAGNPLLPGVSAWFDCRLERVVEAGDHALLLGRIEGFDQAPATPLAYARGHYIGFSLAQEAVAAAADTSQRSRVGAILERDGRLLLLRRPDGSLSLPAADRLGSPGGPGGLLGLLAGLGVEPEIGFLFAVFEDPISGLQSIYYRGGLRGGTPDPARAALLAPEEIPLAALGEPALVAMLRRYLAERREDQFGIYAGDATSGRVQALAGQHTRNATP